MTDSELLDLYRSGQSMKQIAARLGQCRQRVWQRLHALNEPLRPKSAVKKCALPGCTKRTRYFNSRIKNTALLFCCAEHYYAYRPTINPKFYSSRQGQRRGRAEAAKHFDLKPDHVVHHINGDERDNRKENLAVFASSSDHIKHHHGRTVVIPLWEGLPGSTRIRLVTTETDQNEAPDAVSQ